MSETSTYDTVRIYRGRKGLWYWRFERSNGAIMADGAEGYTTRTKCLDGAAYVLGFDEDRVQYNDVERTLFGMDHEAEMRIISDGKLQQGQPMSLAAQERAQRRGGRRRR